MFCFAKEDPAVNFCPPRPCWGLLVFSAVVVLVAHGSLANLPDSSAEPGPLVLEKLDPFVPKRPRTEADEDRLEALTLFAAGRAHERRQQYAEALRFYQRALRRDTKAVVVARAIVPLAFRLKRHAEAVRYALKAVEVEDADPLLLRRLGVYLIETQDFPGALKLYEKAMAVIGTAPSAEVVQLCMDSGRLCHVLGRHDKAAGYFARVRDALDDPEGAGLDARQQKRLLADPETTYNLFGECFLRADRSDEALAAFEKSHQLVPNESLLAYNRARVDSHNGKASEALEGLLAALENGLVGEGVTPYQLLAELLDDLGRKDELIERLENLRADDPDNVPLGYFLAERYRNAERYETAEAHYVKLVEESPTFTGYRSLVEIRRKTDQPDRLLDVLGEVVDKTGDLETLGREVQAIFDDADLMRELVQLARKKHRNDPEDLNYGMRLAVALLALEGKQFETAAEFFELSLEAETEQTVELLTVWGLGLLFGERPAEAAAVFQRAIEFLAKKDPPEENAALYHYLAGALAVDERTDEALAASRRAVAAGDVARLKAATKEIEATTERIRKETALRKLPAKEATEAGQEIKALREATANAILAGRIAVKKQEDLVRYRSREAWIPYRAKRYDQAIEAYLRLISDYRLQYASSVIRDELREARLVLSNLYVLKDDLAEAEEWLELVLDEFPDDVGASNDLGYLWADQDRHLQRALKMIRHAVDAEPDNTAYRDSLGWVFYRLGRYREAVVELEKAAKTEDAPDALILDHLGDAYLEAEQPEKARDAWRRAAAAFREQGEAEKAKQTETKIQDNDKG